MTTFSLFFKKENENQNFLQERMKNRKLCPRMLFGLCCSWSWPILNNKWTHFLKLKPKWCKLKLQCGCNSNIVVNWSKTLSTLSNLFCSRVCLCFNFHRRSHIQTPWELLEVLRVQTVFLSNTSYVDIQLNKMELQLFYSQFLAKISALHRIWLPKSST